MFCVVNNMESQNHNGINPTHRFRGKQRRRFNRDLQVRKIRELVKEINDRDRYGLDKDDFRFRRVGSRRLWEFVLPEGSSVVNGLVFRDIQDGKKECLGTIREFVGGLGK